ncbi:alpha/beta fold hydrolase [Actinophytocola oryzae]|uniref:ABC-2 type transport system ATP-binding protein n=1 Tax=Actinophytocola oryzae TaxID=502181 RepID=A0A4R7V280_9PSEU|nr:alpha/beta fold hydrolase [Actinophytocola oryzae]TDV42662.1 ABC-2 type transport system ATP-binding protein [Actinophytocola oryzae]
MPRIPRPRPRTIAAALVVVIAAAGALVWLNSGDEPPPVHTRDLTLTGAQGPDDKAPVKLDATLYLPEQTPAPAIIVAHGFGGSKQSVANDARELAERGFVALAYSARGFGRSEGQIGLNAIPYEVADASRVVDWLGEQSEVTKDGPDDPKVGVTGGSYGGSLSLLLSGTDKRVDALAPVITYNDLSQALLPNSATTGSVPGTPAANAYAPDGVFKRSWAGIFFSSGLGGAGIADPSADAIEPGSEDDDINAPAGGGTAPASGVPTDGGQEAQPGGAPQQLNADSPCGRFRLDVCAAYAEVATTGRASQKTVDLLKSVSPMTVTKNITQPTMLVQGEQDTLFGLDQADASARQIAAAGGEVKVVWYTGGHDGGKPGPELRAEIADWFDFHLRGRGTDPGTGLEYAVQGALRVQDAPSVRTVSANAYPGLPGDPATQRRQVRIYGPEQTIINPPGGNPAAISSLPGLGAMIGTSSRLVNQLSIDLPGQSARFDSRPLTEQLLIAGASTVKVRVSALPGVAPASQDGAVLFAKLYDVSQDGASRVLPGSAVSPFRIPALPADGSPVDVTVTLPAVVRPVETDHRIELVIATTDQAYATPTQAAAYRVSIADDATVAAPVVSGTRSDGGPPAGPLVGIAIVLGIVVLAAIWGAFRRRRATDHDPSLGDVPLVIEGLSKKYPGDVVAVDDLSFRVEAGQVLGLLGPNGAGKTTSLRMLMGLIQPSGGSIRVFGHKVYSGAPVLSRIGSFVEGAGFLPHLSGEANLELYWAATGRPPSRAHVAEALEIAGLGKAVHRRVRTYSQGMRQRLAIAQAMLGLPDLLVLDEPTNGLDPPQIHQMRAVLRRYASTGRTVVVSSHLLAEVEQTCDHVVVMHHGRLVASGLVEDIVGGGGEATFRVDRPEEAASLLRSVDGVEGVEIEGNQVHADLDGLPRAEALAKLVGAGVAVEQAGPRRRLEDAFLALVGES